MFTALSVIIPVKTIDQVKEFHFKTLLMPHNRNYLELDRMFMYTGVTAKNVT